MSVSPVETIALDCLVFGDRPANERTDEHRRCVQSPLALRASGVNKLQQTIWRQFKATVNTETALGVCAAQCNYIRAHLQKYNSLIVL